MAIIDPIQQQILPKAIIEKTNEGGEKTDGPESPSFATAIRDFIETVNDKQAAAAEKVTAVVEGKSESISEAMATMEESRISFQLLVEIRNKLLDSYKEIQRMTV
ncbi:MAG: flagellar hook-basal body complex protein FliE [Fidelibacterota bacterium]